MKVYFFRIVSGKVDVPVLFCFLLLPSLPLHLLLCSVGSSQKVSLCLNHKSKMLKM